MGKRTAWTRYASLLLLLGSGVAAAQTPPGTASTLDGTSWQLVRFQGMDDTTRTPDDRTKYTLEFQTSGALVVRLDCNRGRGTWKSPEPGRLELGPLALTRAMCPPGSLHDQIVKHWSYVRSYIFKDGHLFIALMADGGIYEFEPMSGENSPFSAPGAAQSRDNADERVGDTQVETASWLDASKPASWNEPAPSIPGAPPVQGNIDPRCRELARPTELEEDRRVRDQGWHLDGAYQGGWEIVVIRGAASYDGMCRPLQFQALVFVRGVFAGTLSREPMDSRTDGALSRVTIQSGNQLTAEYLRYTAEDPLCCASRTTHVVFEVASDGPVVRPVSASTSSNN